MAHEPVHPPHYFARKKSKGGLTPDPKSRLAGLTEEEIKAQMELIRGEGRNLLTDDERASWYNISHNSDNGYLYQDADFLCGAIIKERKAFSACRERSEARRALLEKLQFSEQYYSEPKYACPVCHCNEYHTPNCAIAAELKGTVEDP